MHIDHEVHKNDVLKTQIDESRAKLIHERVVLQERIAEITDAAMLEEMQWICDLCTCLQFKEHLTLKDRAAIIIAASLDHSILDVMARKLALLDFVHVHELDVGTLLHNDITNKLTFPQTQIWNTVCTLLETFVNFNL